MGNDSYDTKVYGQTSTYILNRGDVVNLSVIIYRMCALETCLILTVTLASRKVINWDAGFHPFHLHGHKVQL